jgi:hypothetical protein
MGEIVSFPQQELLHKVATRAVFWCERPNLVHACEAAGIKDGVLATFRRKIECFNIAAGDGRKTRPRRIDWRGS